MVHTMLKQAFPAKPLDADELDIYAEISKDFGFATVAVGYIYYYFPQGDLNRGANGAFQIDDAQEAYISVSKEFYGFEASLAYFWDIESDNDGYSQLSLSKGFELNSALTLNTGVDVGYLVEKGVLSHATAKIGLDYAVTDNATLSPYIAHTWSLRDGFAAGTTSSANGQENELFGGVSLSVSF